MKALQNILLGLFAVVFVIGIVIGFVALRNYSAGSPMINLSHPSVIKQIKALNRYETASYTIEKVIDAGTSQGQLKDFLFGDRILLIAHGEVIAGFDLSQLTENDIAIEKETVTLHLPKPQILLTKLDNDQTRVYDRQTGLLTHGDKNLESEARSEAEKSIQQAACDENILDTAAKNGRTQLTALLKALGFTTVIVTIPIAHC